MKLHSWQQSVNSAALKSWPTCMVLSLLLFETATLPVHAATPPPGFPLGQQLQQTVLMPPALVKVDGIYQENIFDPERKPWQEEAPPQIVAPMAPTAALTENDVQVYGVVIIGDYRKAIVKLGGQFAAAAPTRKPPRAVAPDNSRNVPAATPRPFTTLFEGEQLGQYILSEIKQNGLYFKHNDQQNQEKILIAFNKKNDRQQNPGGGYMPPPNQFPMQPPSIQTPQQPSTQPANPLAAMIAARQQQLQQQQQQQQPNQMPQPVFGGMNPSMPPSDVQQQPPNPSQPLPPGTTLIEAIEAYRSLNSGQQPQ